MLQPRLGPFGVLFVLLGLTLSLSAQLDQVQVPPQPKRADLAVLFREFANTYPVRFYYKSDWLSTRSLPATQDTLPLSTYLTHTLEPLNLGFIFYDEDVIIIAPRTLLESRPLVQSPLQLLVPRYKHKGQ